MIHEVAPIDAVLTGNNLQLQRRMEDAESVSQQQLEGFEQLVGPYFRRIHDMSGHADLAARERPYVQVMQPCHAWHGLNRCHQGSHVNAVWDSLQQDIQGSVPAEGEMTP